MNKKPIRVFRMNVDRLNDFTIGRETENHAAAVEINLSRWLSIWPDGIPAVWLLRPGENTRYPAVTEREGDVIRWLVRDYDVAIPGVARMEVTLQDGENIAISAAAFVTIAHRIGKTDGEAGEVEPDWSKNVIEKTAENAERAEDAAKRAQQIVEEFEPGEGGGITNETDPTVPEWAKQPEKPTYTAEEVGAQPKGDYALKSEIPAIPVQSVNGKTGKVELTAEDVGALPEDTIIPAPYELPTASASVKGGVKVGEGLQMSGETLGIVPEGKYELIEEINITETTIAEIVRTNLSHKAIIATLLSNPDGTKTRGVFLEANTTTRKSIVCGGMYIGTTDTYSSAFQIRKANGRWDPESCGYVKGWGGGNKLGANNASEIEFAADNELIQTIRLYVTHDGSFIVGSRIKIYGVRA